MKPAPAKPVAEVPSHLEQLEAVLRLLVTEHQQLLALTTDHRRALSEADASSLKACLAAQSDVTRRIAALERQRQQLVAVILKQRPGMTAGAPRPTMSTLAAIAPEPIRSRLLSISASLRELLNTLHREHQALRMAAETLSSHMEGVMRQVCRTLSHAGTYARTGIIDAKVQVVSSLDLKT